METKEQVFEKLQALFEEFKQEHGKTTKASAARARKLIGEIKTLCTPYRQKSVEAAKN